MKLSNDNMNDSPVFSWAKTREGNWVHVDDVPNGLKCNCVCPNCNEELEARQGGKRAHGFKHHSEDRRANLAICYWVSLYKLAEHIIESRKKIILPSYYGFFQPQEVSFKSVKVDSSYEREDKQPDVIAESEDGVEYLIQFIFSSKAMHKKAIDYKRMNCIVIDLSNQTMQTVKYFLSSMPNEDWIWMNCDSYFNQLQEWFRQQGFVFNPTNETTCVRCPYAHNCISMRYEDGQIIEVHNNGERYVFCGLESNACIAVQQEEIEAQESTIEQAVPGFIKNNELEVRNQIEERTYTLLSKIYEAASASCDYCKFNSPFLIGSGKSSCSNSFSQYQGMGNSNRAKTCKAYAMLKKQAEDVYGGK